MNILRFAAQTPEAANPLFCTASQEDSLWSESYSLIGRPLPQPEISLAETPQLMLIITCLGRRFPAVRSLSWEEVDSRSFFFPFLDFSGDESRSSFLIFFIFFIEDSRAGLFSFSSTGIRGGISDRSRCHDVRDGAGGGTGTECELQPRYSSSSGISSKPSLSTSSERRPHFFPRASCLQRCHADGSFCSSRVRRFQTWHAKQFSFKYLCWSIAAR